jgi:hypothetical protein
MSLVVMSQCLPEPVVKMLMPIARGIDEGLQAESHNVSTAMAVHAAFDQSYVDTDLTRALVCSLVRTSATPGVLIHDLPNGGCEAQIVYEGVERLFRLKRATRDQDGRLVVKASSDSLLTHRARALKLFDDDGQPYEPPSRTEQWVLPYLITPATRTLIEISAALPVGIRNEHPPYRLVLDNIVRISHTAPPPPNFPKTEDDLDLDDKPEEGGGEATG